MDDHSLYGPIQPGQWLASTSQDQVRYNVPSYGEIQGTLAQVSQQLGQAAFFPTYIPPAGVGTASAPKASMGPVLILGALVVGFFLLRGR